MDGPTIKRRLQERGLTQAQLGVAIGRSPYAINRLLKRTDLKSSELKAIEDFFADAPGFAGGARPPGKIPLFGFAMAQGEDRVAFTPANALDWIEPPELVGGIDAALRIAGESMEPRLFAGEIVYLKLNMPPQRGRDCVVELADDTAIVKTYEARRDGYLYLRQYNPEKTVRYAWDQVRAVHAVRWRD